MTDVERLRKPMQKITDFLLKSMGMKRTAEITIIPNVRNDSLIY